MSLFNKKTISRAIAFADAPDASKLALLRQWAATITSGEIETQKETALHGNFKSKIIVEVLGFRDFNDSGAWTVDVEAQIGAGSVDLAFGHFTADTRNIVAPFELKGAKTKNLDAIMPGRAKSPVDQAWEYATNNVGTKWVLVSNYLEIRLYSYGEGRQAYETFDLRRLHEPEEYARAQLLISAENLLGSRTADLLEESRRENKDITNRLYADYKTLRSDLIGEVRRERPEMDPLAAIRTGQTILDRILFIAFAEDTSLLPPKSIEKAYEHADPYHPRPVWETFQSLFNAIDTGLPKALNIPRYNGGLFALDETINALAIPDHICEGFKRLSEYDFASEISVTVLGHIFEQSIADVEQLQAEARGDAPPEKKTSGTSGRRKRDGVVYTPDYIARFIVEQTLGNHAREIFAKLLSEHAVKGASADDDPIKWKSAAAERAAWTAYRDALAKLRIVDPACGSGVFLVMAFDWLKAELARVNEKLVELTGVGALLDPDSEILTHNLFGVDVNEESVEIAKLSLWIKTARHGKVLDSLDDNFRVGDSLIEDHSIAYRSHGFVWKEAFKDIFAEGGFDIVLGNPPYVHMGRFTELKPYLRKRYVVVAGRADLYAYFFERGLRALKPGGRMGYISSNTFFKTGSGEPLRNYLRENAEIENLVNFGELQVFDGVTTYTTILTMKAGVPSPDHQLRFWNVDEIPSENFSKTFNELVQGYPQNKLGSRPWEFENSTLRLLRDKIKQGKPTLKQAFGSPLYGIKTGLNEAFVIDTPTKERICQEDSRSAELLKPFLEGKDLKPWRSESRSRWIIYIPKNRVNIDEYPAIRSWLLPFKARLENRATSQEWYELQQAQDSCQAHYEGRKIVYGEFAGQSLFSLDFAHYINNKCYFLAQTEQWLLAFLNSSVFWFCVTGESVAVRGAYFQMQSQFVEAVPIPPTTDDQKAALATLAESAQSVAEKRYSLQLEITRRIPDLAPSGNPAKLTDRLKSWWELPDFAAFQAEVKKAFKTDIPLKERNEWENWISETRQQIHSLTAKISALEADINTRVYALFDLTPDEITLLESSL
jgi:type I restriction-modification system DNA methylase subunit